MDAISFVLGVRAGQLRGAQLKDLIYAFYDKEKEQKGRRASVRLVYRFANSSELHFTRTISSSGGSEYRIDGTAVTWDVYNAKLRDLGMLAKARNFLVFQEDLALSTLKNCKQSQPVIKAIIESTADDEGMLFEALYFHDELEQVISKYEQLEATQKAGEQQQPGNSDPVNCEDLEAA